MSTANISPASPHAMLLLIEILVDYISFDVDSCYTSPNIFVGHKV